MVFNQNALAIDENSGSSASRVSLFWTGTLVSMLVSAFIFLLATRHGIGILPDTTRYMGINDIPYDAPMYHWLLMAFTAMGFSLAFGAKLAGLLLVCVNSALIWYLLVRATGKYAYAAAGTALIILSPQFVYLHSVAMSEPLFILSILLSLLALLRFWETEKQSWLIACGVALGAAALVRFTAPALGAAVALALILSPRRRFGQRLMDAIKLALVSSSIFILWTLASELLVGRSTGRPLAFYGNMDAAAWMASLDALLAWLLPGQVPLLGRILLFGLVVLGAVYLSIWHGGRVLRRARTEKVVDAQLPIVLGLFFLSYLGFMVLATAIEANLSFNGRYSIPIYVTTVIMLTILVSHAAEGRGNVRRVQMAFVALAAIVLVSHVARTAVRTKEAHEQGIGFASLAWVNSPTMQAVAGLPADATIYSSGPDAVAYVLERRAHLVPQRFDYRTGRPDPADPLDKQLARARQDLAAGNSFIVFLDRVDWRYYYLVPEPELKRLLDLEMVSDHPDGRIYTRAGAVSQESDR